MVALSGQWLAFATAGHAMYVHRLQNGTKQQIPITNRVSHSTVASSHHHHHLPSRFTVQTAWHYDVDMHTLLRRHSMLSFVSTLWWDRCGALIINIIWLCWVMLLRWKRENYVCGFAVTVCPFYTVELSIFVPLNRIIIIIIIKRKCMDLYIQRKYLHTKS